MNYIILNGKSSATVPGLLISELPPISKPLIRTEVEQIDGRDGDIITKLGYSAYNKELTIGLYGDYDIDEVIQYFNSEGTVTFSNEPDKYYNYQILDQIDFERLIRFRTAKVTMHVQPFKYSVTENKKIFNIDTNLISFNTYSKTTNGIRVSMSSNSITINGEGVSGYTEVYLPINPLVLAAGSYTLNATSSGSGSNACLMKLIGNTSDNSDTFGGSFLSLINGSTATQTAILTKKSTYSYLWFYITPGIEINFTLNISLTNNNPVTSLSIRNNGNIYSKPTITIYGENNIEISLNGSTLFNISLGNYGYVTIDTNLMEAYKGATLLNRYVTGNYDNFKLNIGINTISWTGNINKIIISNYSRWI